jgi:predicted branched-subunit amino acid permease
VIAFFNTDEIFALAMAEKEPLSTAFMLGLGLTPILGWIGGTLCGALAGSVLPPAIRTALGMMLYGMFVAIVVPPAKEKKPVLIAALLALVASCLLRWVPVLNRISAGVAIVIATVASAAVCAWLFPVEEEAQA